MPLRTEEQQLRIRKNEEPGFFPLSYSRIDSYKRCARRYKYENIDKLGRESGDYADLGSAAHVFQEVMFTDGIDAANDAARAMVPLSKSQEWMNAKAVIESIVIKKDHLFLAEGRMHWEFPAIKEMKDANSQRANELGISSSEVYTIQIEAKIDQLFVYPDTKTIEIIDGKSGTQVPNETELKQNVQGKTYAVVVLENLAGLDIETVIFTQAQWHYGKLVSAKFSIEELGEYKQQLMAIGQEMLNEQKYEPTTGNHCHWCPFVLMCDAAQKKLPKMVKIAGVELPPVITNDEEAEQIGQGVIHLEEVLKRFKAAIRGYTEETGKPIRIGEGGWGKFRRSTLKIDDLSVLLKKAEEDKVDLTPYLSFNNKTGKTLIKDHPKLKQGLVEEHYPFFDFKAKLNEDD